MEITKTRQYLLEGLLVILILSLGLFLRVHNIQATEADALRSDAIDYYSYAVNLKYFGVYSRVNPTQTIAKNTPPKPDKYRPPAYPLFIYPYVDYPPKYSMLGDITMAQAIVSSLTVFFIFIISRMLLPFWASMTATGLTAISPHLIATDAFILTETLFTFILVANLLFYMLLIESNKYIWAAASGITLGLSLLIKPTMTYSLLFLIPVMAITFKEKGINYKLLLATMAFFILTIAPWHLRNTSLPDTAQVTKKSLVKISIHNGSYPDLMVNNDIKTQGKPHRDNPEYDNYQTLPEITRHILIRAKENPSQYLNWYTWGKMDMLFSWGIIAGWGDIFVYPVKSSPYFSSHLFYDSRAAMLHTHYPISIIAILVIFWLWHPQAKQLLPEPTLYVGRYISALFLYFMAVHQVGTPLPRYSIPLRPELYFMFSLGLWSFYLLIKARKNKNDAT